MTKFYFVRHGQTDLNLQMRCQGRLDYPLNEEGKRQLGETAKIFRDKKIDKMYSSPLLRAQQSAEIVAGGKELIIHILEQIVEIDHGELEGMNEDDAAEKYPGMLADWVERPDKVNFPGGECLEDVRDRMLSGLKEVVRTDEGKTVLLLTHQVLSCVARCHFEGRPLAEIWRNKLAPGGYFAMNIEEVGDRLELNKPLGSDVFTAVIQAEG